MSEEERVTQDETEVKYRIGKVTYRRDGDTVTLVFVDGWRDESHPMHSLPYPKSAFEKGKDGTMP